MNMKKHVLVLVAGLAAIGIFSIIALNSTKRAPATPEETPAQTADQKPKPTPVTPPENEGAALANADGEGADSAPKKIILDGDQSKIVRNGKEIDLAQFVVRAKPGEIDEAIEMYRTETDPYEKLNRLADLGYQPKESKKIHNLLLENLQSSDPETHEVAFQTIIIYEDEAMIPELKKLAETANSAAVKQKAQEAVELLEAPAYSELYLEAKTNK